MPLSTRSKPPHETRPFLSASGGHRPPWATSTVGIGRDIRPRCRTGQQMTCAPARARDYAPSLRQCAPGHVRAWRLTKPPGMVTIKRGSEARFPLTRDAMCSHTRDHAWLFRPAQQASASPRVLRVDRVLQHRASLTCTHRVQTRVPLSSTTWDLLLLRASPTTNGFGAHPPGRLRDQQPADALTLPEGANCDPVFLQVSISGTAKF